MTDIEGRLKRLEAAEAIRQCVYDYALAGDRKNDAAIMRRIFTDGAVYEAAGMGRFEGLDSIVRGLSQIADGVVLWAFHSQGGPRIMLSDDAESAKVFWWVWCPARLRAEDGTEKPCWGAGHYNGELRNDGGTWKFQRLLFETLLRTPYAGPWTEIEGPFEWPIGT